MATNHKPTKRKNILPWMESRLRRLQGTPEQHQTKRVKERVVQLKAQITMERKKLGVKMKKARAA